MQHILTGLTWHGSAACSASKQLCVASQQRAGAAAAMPAPCSTPAVAPDTGHTPQTASNIARRLLCLPWQCCQACMNKSPFVLQATGAAPYNGGPLPASLTLRGSGKRKLQNISSDLQVNALELQQSSPLVCLGLLHGRNLAAAELLAAAAYSFRLGRLPCACSQGFNARPVNTQAAVLCTCCWLHRPPATTSSL